MAAWPGRRAAGLLTTLLAGLLAALSAGCARPPPPSPPLLGLKRTDCDVAPAFSSALPVRTDGAGMSATLGEGGRCLAVPGGSPTTYAVFELPPGPAPYTLEIVSSVVPDTIVRPSATLFDAPGQPIRFVPPAEFETNIVGLRAGVRPRGTERFLVVTADQSQLGQTLFLQLGEAGGPLRTAAAAVIILPIIPPAIPDLVRQRRAMFALNGRITVIAVPARSVQVAALPDGS